MNKATRILLTAAFAVMASGAAMAGKGPSYICAYVNDNADGPNFVEGYKVGPGTTTTHVGPYSTNGRGTSGGPFEGGMGATRAHPRLKTADLYVDDAGSENITHFTINKTDCTLALDTSLYPSGDTNLNGDSLAISPDGRTMYVGSRGDFRIYSHTIAANGSLGAAFMESSTPSYPDGFEVSPDGKTLVVSYYEILRVCAYPISGGHLGKPNCRNTSSYPAGISIDPASACVYAAEGNGEPSQIAAFTLTGGVLGTPNYYNPFGPGQNADDVQVDWDNMAVYVTEAYSGQLSMGTIAPGCKLTYKSSISDGGSGGIPGQIAQSEIVHGYVVTGDLNNSTTPSMGIFIAHANGKLTPLGSGQFPLMSGFVAPSTVVVVGAK
jgi:6-phosphogluconolactonase (cycloisomerase 2 family)